MHPLIQLTVYIITYILTIYLGSALVEKVLAKTGFKEQNMPTSEIKGAGKTIGKLERILTLTFILLGEPTAIAIIFAAKSIIRFEAAKERPYAEYYLIGTLTSMTFAIIMGAIALQIANL